MDRKTLQTASKDQTAGTPDIKSARESKGQPSERALDGIRLL